MKLIKQSRKLNRVALVAGYVKIFIQELQFFSKCENQTHLFSFQQQILLTLLILATIIFNKILSCLLQEFKQKIQFQLEQCAFYNKSCHRFCFGSISRETDSDSNTKSIAFRGHQINLRLFGNFSNTQKQQHIKGLFKNT